MELIVYTANAVLPVFVVIFVGLLLNRLNFFSEKTKNEIVKLVFYVGTPCLIFHNISTSDIHQSFDGKFFLFTLALILVLIGVVIAMCFFIQDKKKKGAVIQLAYRSNFAIAGMPIAVNLLDGAGVTLTAVTLSFVIILYNVSAVIILSYYGGEKKSPGAVILGILKNPLIIGTALGLLFAVFQIPVFPIAEKSIKTLGDIASCMGLIIIGASITLRGFQEDKEYILFASFLRNLFAPAFVLITATLFGWRGNHLMVLAIMSASPAAVNCFAMAKQMGVSAEISAYGISISSVLSVFSIFISVYLIKFFGLA